MFTDWKECFLLLPEIELSGWATGLRTRRKKILSCLAKRSKFGIFTWIFEKKYWVKGSVEQPWLSKVNIQVGNKCVWLRVSVCGYINTLCWKHDIYSWSHITWVTRRFSINSIFRIVLLQAWLRAWSQGITVFTRSQSTYWGGIKKWIIRLETL